MSQNVPNSKHSSSNSSVVYLDDTISHKMVEKTEHKRKTYSRPSSLKSAALSTEMVGMMRGLFLATV
jgi:hypothetical protein